jgi:hypothetical protein
MELISFCCYYRIDVYSFYHHARLSCYILSSRRDFGLFEERSINISVLFDVWKFLPNFRNPKCFSSWNLELESRDLRQVPFFLALHMFC